MKATFVESTEFTEWVSEHLPDGSYAELRVFLMEYPDAGAVMPGCGGLRKIRIPDPKRRKGTRGGARVIYLYIPMAKRFYMLDIYGKDEKDDLSPSEKKLLRLLAEYLQREAKAAYARSIKDNE